MTALRTAPSPQMDLSDRFVVLDLDQTLIENAGMTPVWQEVCRRRGADLEHALTVWRKSAGRPMHEQVAEAFRISAADALVDEIVADFWQDLGAGDPTPVQGAAQMLTDLSAAGAQLYLSTASDPRPVETWLDVLGWHHHFRLVLATNRELAKGDGHYRRILQDAGVAPEEFAARAASIGDGAYDMRFARAQGVALRVGYAPDSEHGRIMRPQLKAAGANLLIDDLAEVVPILTSDDAFAVARWRP